jgi:hypothetical protein
MPTNPMSALKTFFGYKNLAMFRAAWEKLTETDKDQLRSGIENGTLTY